MKPFYFALCVASLPVFALTAAEEKKMPDISKLPPASDKKGVAYEKDIKPIFDKSCVSCHGAEKQKGKLRLDSLAAALKGGGEGPVIVPGNSAKSTLVHGIARLGEEDYWMPPADNVDKIPPLTSEQIGLVRAWIDQGAK